MDVKEMQKKYKFLIQDHDETFRLYADRSEIGKRILKSLQGKRDGVNAIGEACKGFYLSSRNKEVGFMSQLYGGNALFSLVNRFGAAANNDVKKQAKECVQFVLEYLEENDAHYDVSPILDPDINSKLFLENDYNYIGAMTWALSLFCAARKAHRKNFIEFSTREMNLIYKHIRGIIKFFVQNVIRDDKNGRLPLGWGYTNGCKEPSLFFSYSVVEAFADFDDSVLGGVLNDEAQQAINRDDELIEKIDNPQGNENLPDDERLTKQFVELCFAVGDRTWKLYGKVLKNEFFSDNFSDDFKIVSEEEILNSSRSAVLFNTLYAVFTLFNSYVNLRNHDEEDEIVNTMMLALQKIQNFYNELCALGKEGIVDRHIIAFDQSHEDNSEFGKILNEENIQASTFLPMLVKAHSLIALYILRYPQQQMNQLFDMILEAKAEQPDEWLWEKRRFDLLSTERYLEAIADFFDYYDEFERNYAIRSIDKTKQEAELRKELRVEVISEVEKDLEQKHNQEIEQLKVSIAQQFPLEVAINQQRYF